MSRRWGGGGATPPGAGLQLGGLVLIAVLGLVLVLAGFFEWLGLPAQLNGLWFVLFLQPLVFALATLGRQRRADREERRVRAWAEAAAADGHPPPVPGSAAQARAVREAAADRRRRLGLMRSSSPEELPYAFDYALGRLEVLADRVAEERLRPLEDRATSATDDSLEHVAGHLARSRETLDSGHVDLAEMHFDKIPPIVTQLWAHDSPLSSDLLAARRSFFGTP